MQTKDLRMTINIVIYSDYNYMLLLIYVVSFDDVVNLQSPSSNKKKASCSSCSSKAAPRKDIGGVVGVSRVLVVVKHRFGGVSFCRGKEDLKLAPGGWLLALHP